MQNFTIVNLNRHHKEIGNYKFEVLTGDGISFKKKENSGQTHNDILVAAVSLATPEFLIFMAMGPFMVWEALR